MTTKTQTAINNPQWNDSIFQGWHEEEGLGRVQRDGGTYSAYAFVSDAFAGSYVFCGHYSTLRGAKEACADY